MNFFCELLGVRRQFSSVLLLLLFLDLTNDPHYAVLIHPQFTLFHENGGNSFTPIQNSR